MDFEWDENKRAINLAEHGLDLIGSVYEAIELECSDHRVMVI